MMMMMMMIRDQSQKLSGITSKFGRFFGFPNFFGRAFQKIVPTLSPLPRGTSLEKFRVDTATSPEVIGAHTLNLRPNFKYLPLNFFGGGHVSPLGCTLTSLGQSLERVKI